MATEDRIYFARRAAEEQERARRPRDPDVAEAHRKLQRAYLERASVGDRPESAPSRSADQSSASPRLRCVSSTARCRASSRACSSRA